METNFERDTVIQALESFELRTTEIVSRIDGRRQIGAFEKGELQALYAALKDDVKAAGKRGKVADDRAPQTDWERYFFTPALLKAATMLRAKSNTHPITSNWIGSLLDAGTEFSYYLHQLKKSSPESR